MLHIRVFSGFHTHGFWCQDSFANTWGQLWQQWNILHVVKAVNSMHQFHCVDQMESQIVVQSKQLCKGEDSFEAVTGFPNIGNQMIICFYTTKKPPLISAHEYMQCQAQLLASLKNDYSDQPWSSLQHKKKQNRTSWDNQRSTNPSKMIRTKVCLQT